jgi:hypothetical protein
MDFYIIWKTWDLVSDCVGWNCGSFMPRFALLFALIHEGSLSEILAIEFLQITSLTLEEF